MFIGDLKTGETKTVKGFKCEKKYIDRFWELGVIKGSKITLIKIKKFGLVLVTCDGILIAFSKKFLTEIVVE